MATLGEIANSIELLTFDCYGTLVDWEAGIAASFAELGVPPDQRDDVIDAYVRTEAAIEQQGYQPYREVQAATLAMVARDFGLPFADEQRGHLSRSLPDWPPFADTVAALRRLKNRYKLGILSNIDRDLFAGTRQHLDVEFDLIITAEDVRSYKPAHPHFLAMLEHIGGRERVLHVAQSLYHDARPAGELHLNYVWINRYGGKADKDVKMLAEFANLAELADALGA
ncbi:MAG: haloacid dehalogenase type II [Phycisphaerales bacterium]|nr:haloacid dehalogenase type II [Phycisphaerales bacterium]